MMRMPIVTLGATLLVAFLVACGDLDDQDDSDSEVSGAQPTATEAVTPEATDDVPAIDADSDLDPREVVMALVQDPEDPDLELVYQHLAERFRVLPFDELWVRTLAHGLPNSAYNRLSGLEVDDLILREYDGYAVVNHAEINTSRWVMVVEDGQWRWDPGDLRLIRASGQLQAGPEQGFSIGLSDPRAWIEIESDPETRLLPNPVGFGIHGVGVRDDGIEVALEARASAASRVVGSGSRNQIDSHLLSDAIVALDQTYWSAGDETGPVEIIWTNGGVVDEELILPGWQDREAAEVLMGESPTLPPIIHGLTLRLVDAPADADEIVLEFGEIRVGPFGDDADDLEGETVRLRYEFGFPAVTTDPIMIGEAPVPYFESGREDAPQTPADQDVRPAPALSESLQIRDVEYIIEDDSAEVHIQLDGDVLDFEIPGRVVVVWEDGGASEAVPVDGSMLDYSAERIIAPFDVRVSEIRFSGVVRKLGTDTEAMIDDQFISTEWGDFAYSLRPDGRQISYDPYDRRYIQRIAIEQHGERHEARGTGTSFDAMFRPTSGRLEMTIDLGAILDGSPVAVEVEVWKAEQDVVLEVDD